MTAVYYYYYYTPAAAAAVAAATTTTVPPTTFVLLPAKAGILNRNGSSNRPLDVSPSDIHQQALPQTGAATPQTRLRASWSRQGLQGFQETISAFRGLGLHAMRVLLLQASGVQTLTLGLSM